MNDHVFVTGADERFLKGAPIVLSFGAARSGKSTLASLAASMCHVDHQDEPVEIIVQGALSYMGLQVNQVSSELIRAFISELKCESVLMRRANFRPYDASSIWKTKGLREIYLRLFKLKSRVDGLNYMHGNSHRLWITATDLLPVADLFSSDLFPCQKVLVIRDPLEVSNAIQEKGWFADASLKKPVFNTPVTPHHDSRSSEVWYMPWWLEFENFEVFIASDEIGRGLLYWDSIHKPIQNTKVSDFEVFSFSQIFTNTSEVVDRLSCLLDKKASRKTSKIIKNLNTLRKTKSDISSSSEDLYNSILSKYQLNF
jgi:hypothetical protein